MDALRNQMGTDFPNLSTWEFFEGVDPVAIIDPTAETEQDLITIMWSTERAADYLTYLRDRHANRKVKKRKSS